LKFALSPARVSTHGYARGYSLANLRAAHNSGYAAA